MRDRSRLQNRFAHRLAAVVAGAIFTAVLVVHPATAAACCTIPPPPPCEIHPEMCA
jgi:hypothetical protein